MKNDVNESIGTMGIGRKEGKINPRNEGKTCDQEKPQQSNNLRKPCSVGNRIKTSAPIGSNANIHAFGNVGISSNCNSPIDVYSFDAKWTNCTRIELVGLVGKN